METSSSEFTAKKIKKNIKKIHKMVQFGGKNNTKIFQVKCSDVFKEFVFNVCINIMSGSKYIIDLMSSGTLMSLILRRHMLTLHHLIFQGGKEKTLLVSGVGILTSRTPNAPTRLVFTEHSGNILGG